MKILVSSCLVGCNCRYNGVTLESLNLEEFEVVSVCPEVLGGLSIPRAPSELIGDRVINDKGEDVTEAFILGARKALEIMKQEAVEIALLKENSPSCGVNYIYDGSFSSKKIPGRGIFTQLLKELGYEVYSEAELDLLRARKYEEE